MNQVKAGVLLSYASIVASGVVNLIYTPIMLRFLGQSEYGLYSLCASVIGYLGLINMGFGSAYIRYYSIFKAKNDELKIRQLNGMFMNVFLFLAGIVIVAGSYVVFNLHYVLGDKFTSGELNLAKILMSIMVFNLAVSLPSSVYSSFVSANERFIFQKSVEVLRILCNPILTLPLLVMGYQSIAVVSVATLLTVVSFMLNLWFCVSYLRMRFEFKNMDFDLLKKIFIFSFFIFLQIIMDKMNWEINKLIVGHHGGGIAVAIYSIGLQLNLIFIQFSTAISGVFIPKINKLVAENQGDQEISKLFVKVGRIQYIVVFFVFTAFVIFGKAFVLFWAGSGYESSYVVGVLLMFPILIPLTETIAIEILRAKNLHGFINCVYVIVAVCNVVIAIPLVNQYGVIGGAVATCITMFVAHVIIANLYYHFKAGIDIKLYLNQIGKIMPANILPCLYGGILFFYIQINTIVEFIFYVFIYVVIYGLSYWKFGLNLFEKNLLCSGIKKAKKILV